MIFNQTTNSLCLFRKPNPRITIQTSQFKSYLEECQSENVVGYFRKIIAGIKRAFLKEWCRLEGDKEMVDNINSNETRNKRVITKELNKQY